MPGKNALTARRFKTSESLQPERAFTHQAELSDR